MIDSVQGMVEEFVNNTLEMPQESMMMNAVAPVEGSLVVDDLTMSHETLWKWPLLMMWNRQSLRLT